MFNTDLFYKLSFTESWLIYRGKDVGISSFIYNAFEEDIRTNETVATKLLAVKPKVIHLQSIFYVISVNMYWDNIIK